MTMVPCPVSCVPSSLPLLCVCVLPWGAPSSQLLPACSAGGCWLPVLLVWVVLLRCWWREVSARAKVMYFWQYTL